MALAPTSSGGGVASGYGRGLLRVVSPAELQRSEEERNLVALQVDNQPALAELARHVRTQWEIMRNHRNSGSPSLSEKLLRAQRTFEGVYDPDKLQQIRQFGGSEVYARLTAVKCRGATSLLRDVYLGKERPWDVEPTPDPEIPTDIIGDIMRLVQVEVETLRQAGMPITEDMTRDRVAGLLRQARRAAKKQAADAAALTAEKLDDLLVEGEFYRALAEFLVDLPIFPFAVIKGPVVRIVPDVRWRDGKAVVEMRAKLFWNRVSPFDIYWTPGASDIRDASVIEKLKLSRTDLNDLLGLPGYNDAAIRSVLEEYGRGGLVDWLDSTDSERADGEGRENPNTNRSELIDTLEFHGNVQGSLLIDYGMSEKDIPDPLRDYNVQIWQIGRHTIKAQINPSPRKRHPYYVTSYEKVPGTIAGHGLVDILEDVQEVCNATLRALVNNASISSGPQVVIYSDRMAPNSDMATLYPWKRWYAMSDPMGNAAARPVDFFQPNSYAGPLLQVYKEFTNIADELSAVPRYITGTERLGGAGRTASGLSMLMNNASKILQTVAANIDMDVMEDSLRALFDMLMLTDTSGVLRGDENIVVKGVAVSVQKETERAKQLEFLQITANPLDTQIVGLEGRAQVLRAVADTLGLPTNVVPDDETLAARQQAAMAAPMPAGGAPGDPAAQAQGAQAPQAQPARLSDQAAPINLQQQRSRP